MRRLCLRFRELAFAAAARAPADASADPLDGKVQFRDHRLLGTVESCQTGFVLLLADAEPGRSVVLTLGIGHVAGLAEERAGILTKAVDGGSADAPRRIPWR